MLDPENLSDLIDIAQIAVNAMINRGFIDFSIEFILWDDDDSHWFVGFYCERGNIEQIGVAVAPYQGSYKFAGFYENKAQK